ncbi:hypothetical protein [Brevundimonas sp. 374]|uniref:hypothetical protein n=1 Tax=Brevundimonas sp. 374 TaxID=1150400 RepID=UPI00115F79BE|nr:hypothetical protein [Brevundimonas sp. 374]
MTVTLRNFGGAAGFVINEVSLTADHDDFPVAELSHLSTSKVTWTSNHDVTMCYDGVMTKGASVWTQSIKGRDVTVRLDENCQNSETVRVSIAQA